LLDFGNDEVVSCKRSLLQLHDLIPEFGNFVVCSALGSSEERVFDEEFVVEVDPGFAFDVAALVAGFSAGVPGV
jgi:hypothetical protein